MGQISSSPADTAPNTPPGVQSVDPQGRYESGFEILDEKYDGEKLSGYVIEVLGTVRKKWYPQISALRKSIGRKSGTTIIEFEIRKDGSLEKLTVAKSAGDAALDRAAADAIFSSAPFPRLPEATRQKVVRFGMRFGYDQPGTAEAPVCDGPNGGAHPAPYALHKSEENGFEQPKVVSDRDPEYSEDARKAKYMGTLKIAGTVDPQGAFTDLCVSEALGKGLDENAMKAVRTWKFQPATMRGEPVAVRINTEVTFNLY